MWSVLRSVGAYFGFIEPEIKYDTSNLAMGDEENRVEFSDSTDYILTVVQKRKKREHIGKITYLNDRVAVIDNEFYFHLKNVNLSYLRVSDKVKCNLYSTDLDTLVRDVELIEGNSDEESELNTSPAFKLKRELNGMHEEIINGIITKRFARDVCVKRDDGQGNINLSLDKISSEFIPVVGDFVELTVFVPDNNMGDPDTGIIVEKIAPVMPSTRSGIVTSWDGTKGTISNYAVFSILACEPGYQPTQGDKVLCSLIKSRIEVYSWRAIQIIPQAKQVGGTIGKQGEIEQKELLKNKFGISIEEVKRVVVNIGEKKIVTVTVSNKSDHDTMLTECSIFTTKELSQVKLLQPKNTKLLIKANAKVEFTFEILGRRSSEQCIWIFWGYRIGRIFNIEVGDSSLTQGSENENVLHLPRKDVTATQLLDRSSGIIMPGRRSFSPAAFVPVKLGQFSLSEKILKAALPDIKMNLDDLMIRVVKILPCLAEDLQPKTYLVRMHSLLYLEEVAMLKQVGELELQRASFKRGGDCLILEVPPLSAYTTKLVAGDMLIARLPWAKKQNEPKYEGVIHRVTQTQLYLQFSQDFHDTYIEGTDYSVSFVTSRASLRRMHQAINLAVKHLGMQWLFPTLVKPRPPQVIIKDETIVDQRAHSTKSNNFDNEDLGSLLEKN